MQITIDASTCAHTNNGDPVVYICPKCLDTLWMCPDPWCRDVLHHTGDNDDLIGPNDPIPAVPHDADGHVMTKHGCRYDVPYKNAICIVITNAKKKEIS